MVCCRKGLMQTAPVRLECLWGCVSVLSFKYLFFIIVEIKTFCWWCLLLSCSFAEGGASQVVMGTAGDLGRGGAVVEAI